VLEVVAGPASGSRLALAGETLVIGRSEEGPGALGGDSELSRRHAQVRRLPDGRLLVEDLGSTNGTYVNGSRIPASTVLSPDDELAVGESTLRVLASAPPAGAVAGPPPRETRPALRVVAGWAPGSLIPVDDSTTLGREAEGAEAFQGDAAIAGEHVRVTPAGRDALLVEDLGGGTLVNGAPIPAPTLVRVGERFEIGGSTLEVVAAAGLVRGAAADRSKVLGGVREVPEGLFARIAMRAPVSAPEVRQEAALALGWSLALVLLFREFAFDVLDVPKDLNALELSSILPATIFPIVGNSFGFYKIFRRPDDTSVRRYLGPTLIVPLVFVAINLVRINHSGGVELASTIFVTLLPVIICAVLMLKLRDRVARARVSAVTSG